jgi:hypothetical protein
MLQSSAQLSLRFGTRGELLAEAGQRARRNEEQCQTAHRRDTNPTDEYDCHAANEAFSVPRAIPAAKAAWRMLFFLTPR